MPRLLQIALLALGVVYAQALGDSNELLRRARSIAAGINTWRAEVVERSQISGGGLNIESEVRTKILVGTPLKLSRKNKGDDKTILICDGVDTFYSGDGHSYYRGKAAVMPQCDFPLSKFYELDDNSSSTSIIGHDRVRLADGNRPCVLVKTTSNRDSVSTVHIMCIDTASAFILRDIAEINDNKTGVRMVKTTTFAEFETNPSLPPDTFTFPIMDPALEAKPPL